MRILIAEDDPKLLKSLLRIFELNHYTADGVNNGTDAFDFAFSGEYDGLVLDIMMPGLDGITLLKKPRAMIFPFKDRNRLSLRAMADSFFYPSLPQKKSPAPWCRTFFV